MENQTPITPTPVTNEPPQIPVSPTLKFSKIVILAVFILVLMGGSLFAGIQIGKNQTSKIQNVNVPTTTPSTEPTSSTTINWKTYNNTNLGFGIDYPSNWQIVKDNPNTFYVIGFGKNNTFADVYITVFDNLKNLSLSEYYKNVSDTSEMTIPNPFESTSFPPQYTTIDGRDAVRLVIPGAVFNEEVAIKLENRILMIDRHLDGEGKSTDKEIESIYNEMIKTLKFSK